MAFEQKRIGIIGMGLIGGSIARALKQKGKAYFIKAWDQDCETIYAALQDKVIDVEAVSLKDGFSDCDIIFLCIPVHAMKPVIRELKQGHLLPHAVLTDVGSTKGDIVKLIQEIGLDRSFVGGHPLAGSEKSGYKASKANLFENAYYCLTPLEETDKQALLALKAIIQDMGAIPIELSPEEHDRATAAISHVPHIIAALLVNLIGKLDSPDNIMKTIAAGGFKDITRIASSSPELWTGICLSNREIILETLSALGDALKTFEEDLKEGRKEGMEAFFTSARNLRNTFSERKSLIQKTFAIVVDVDDRPGIIALIASALAEKNINIKNIGILNNRETEEGALEIQFEDEASRQQGIITLHNLGYRAKARE